MAKKKRPYISGFWGTVTFVCGRASCTKAQLEIVSTGKGAEYQCPDCGTRISYLEVNEVVDDLAAIIVNEAEVGCDINLLNFKKKVTVKTTGVTHTYEVIEHKNERIKVAINDGYKQM